jgi:hypothetical protein
MVSGRFRHLLWLFLTAAHPVAQAQHDSSCQACDREMRKTFEAIQAWRRSHNGSFPDRLVDLKTDRLLPLESAICPDVLRELHGASVAFSGTSSSADAADPPEFYEYEMSAKVPKWEGDLPYLPPNPPHYTRQDLKSILLRRPFFYQVPILRCKSHRDAAPKEFAGENDGWRNLTVKGKVYWSKRRWEQNWLDDVPYCARDANVIFGLKGPPFCTDKAPTLSAALDLRRWSCAFGDHPWWWTYPKFEPWDGGQMAARLQPFFQEDPGRVLKLDGEEWWLDGLVQLQGRIKRDNETDFDAFRMDAFVWKKTGASVGRAFRQATWLQGTVWTASLGEIAGWLMWHYADGSFERVPIIYGRNTARFWGEPDQIQGEKDFVEPVWRHHETKEEVGKERWLRLYRQDWVNPRPEVEVTSLDFVSNQECRAAPFLIAINVFP